MPEKRELLESMTIEELRLMAKAKGITDYSDKAKSELVDLVAKEYKKEEIEDWLGIGEPEEPEIEEKREESPSAGKRFKSNLLVVGVIVCIVAIVIGFSAGYFWLGIGGDSSNNGDYTEYVNENLNFSFSIPSGWYVQNSPYSENMFLIVDNTENRARALGEVSVVEGENTLDEITNYIQKQIENDDNVRFVNGPESVKEGKGVHFELDWTRPQGILKTRYLLVKDELLYRIVMGVSENNYGMYEKNIDEIFDTFDSF